MTRSRILIAGASALVVALVAFGRPTNVAAGLHDGSRADGSNGRLYYGKAVSVGNGTVRSYVVVDKTNPATPIEVGVSLSEGVMDSLPAPMAMAHDMEMNNWLLDLPANNPTAYKFVQFGWNPAGHEPAGVYDQPHFDFHFWTESVAFRNSIVPTDSLYAQKAARYPAEELRAKFYIDAATPAGVPPAAASVPGMGMHWLDVRSPELQGMAGKPADFKPFTKTFIYGSWDGKFVFDEPMITRAYILAKKTATDAAVRDEIVPVSVPAKHASAGFSPGAYRIVWDGAEKEYRIALTQFARRP